MRLKLFLFIVAILFSHQIFAQREWKLSVQMWSFHLYDFQTGIAKADSCGLKWIEAYPGQKMGPGFEHAIGPAMSFAERQKLKALLNARQMKLISFGVVEVEKEEDWLPYFEFCKDLGIPYMTAEPKKEHLDAVNELARAYKMKVAIHDHPKPSPYWHPDSVLAAIKGRPYIGACADIGHWVRNGLNVEECLKKLKGHVFGLHFKDVASNSPDTEDVVLGEGVCNIPAVLAELKRQQFKGFLSLEHEAFFDNNVPELKKDMVYYYEQLKHLK